MTSMKADQPRVAGKFAKKPKPSTKAHFMPWWVYAGVLAAASILNQISTVTGTVVPAGIIVVAGAITVLTVRAKAARRGLAPNDTSAGVIAAAAATVWALLWMVLDPSWLLFFLGCAFTALAGIPWWRNRHIPNLIPILAVEPETEMVIEIPIIEDTEPTGDAILIDKWDTRIADEGGLKNVRLTHLETDERGNVHKFLVQLIEGKQTFETLLGAQGRIAGAMNVPDPNIVIERGDEASKAILTIVTGLDLGKVKAWHRPMYNAANGTVELGSYNDDDSGAVLSIIVKNGMFGVTFCGAQGTGKSACMEQVILSLLASGLFSLLYIDPQGGMSSPMLAEAAEWTAKSVEEGVALLKTLPRMREYRQAKLARAGKKGFTPTREMPGVIIAIDEFHEMAAIPEARAILNKLAKTIRKVGMGLFIATQDLGLEAFGGDQSLRTQLTAKNVVYFATPSKVQGHLTGHNEFDPSTLPMIPGFGYLKEVLADDGKQLTRPAPFRAYYFGDDETFGENAGLHWLKRMRRQCSFATFDRGSAGAMGSAYRNRHTLHEQQLQNAEALIDACERAGDGLISDEELEDLFANEGNRTPKPSTIAPLDFDFVIGGTPPASAPADPIASIEGKRRAIVEAIRSGAWAPAEIQRHIELAGTPISKSYIEQQLAGDKPGNLLDAGFATRIEFGHYHAGGFEGNCGKCRSDVSASARNTSGHSANQGTAETFADTYDAAMETTNGY